MRGFEPLNILFEFTSTTVERGGNSVGNFNCLQWRAVALMHPMASFILIL